MKYIFDFDIINNKQVLTIDILAGLPSDAKVHRIFNVSDLIGSNKLIPNILKNLLNNMRFTVKERQNAEYNLEKFLHYLCYENRNT